VEIFSPLLACAVVPCEGSNRSLVAANGLFVSLVYWAESTVRWFVVREKYCWMAADSADKSKRTGRKLSFTSGCVQIRNIREKYSCSTFVVIWQNLSNHKLNRLKRFISTFTDKLYN
jgi:hypothetical protein